MNFVFIMLFYLVFKLRVLFLFKNVNKNILPFPFMKNLDISISGFEKNMYIKMVMGKDLCAHVCVCVFVCACVSV